MREDGSQKNPVNRSVFGRKPKIHGSLRAQRIVELVPGIEMVEGKIRIARRDVFLAPENGVTGYVYSNVSPDRRLSADQLKGIPTEATPDFHRGTAFRQPHKCLIIEHVFF